MAKNTYVQPKVTISLDGDTYPLTYVAQRLRDILGVDGEQYGMETALRDFHRECLINLGTCALNRHLDAEEDEQ